MSYFSPRTFRFLKELAANNEREWFAENKERYEQHVREPGLQFVSDFGPRLRKISPHFRADPRKSGGSMFRIHRDVRFSKDKSPYKTYTGIQFRHEAGKDAHAPGFYLHIQPGEVFMGAGIWRPDATTLAKIREKIAEDPKAWKRAIGAKAFKEHFHLSGSSLKRPPRGFDAEHPQIEDLKRKDFIAVKNLRQSDVTKPGFIDDFAKLCRAASSLQKFLCQTTGHAY